MAAGYFRLQSLWINALAYFKTRQRIFLLAGCLSHKFQAPGKSPPISVLLVSIGSGNSPSRLY